MHHIIFILHTGPLSVQQCDQGCVLQRGGPTHPPLQPSQAQQDECGEHGGGEGSRERLGGVQHVGRKGHAALLGVTGQPR